MQEAQDLEQQEELEENTPVQNDFAGVSSEEFAEFLTIYQNHIEAQESYYNTLNEILAVNEEILQSDSLSETDRMFLMAATEEQEPQIDEASASVAHVSLYADLAIIGVVVVVLPIMLLTKILKSVFGLATRYI